MTVKPTACASDPALFDSTDVVDHTEAARHCRVCPALDWCREQMTVALASAASARTHAPRGTWAGQLLSPRTAAAHRRKAVAARASV